MQDRLVKDLRLSTIEVTNAFLLSFLADQKRMLRPLVIQRVRCAPRGPAKHFAQDISHSIVRCKLLSSKIPLMPLRGVANARLKMARRGPATFLGAAERG